VRRLVLGCTTPGGPHAVERSHDVRRALADPDPAKARATLLDLMYTPDWLAAHPGPYTVIGSRDLPPHARRHHLLASNQHDAWDALPGITAPSLILHGDDDRMAPPANAKLLAERIPDARAHLFPGARHAYFEECRPHASAIVTEFLTRP
jgi:pimeloyl-ACP methyl ester carboxylesterase